MQIPKIRMVFDLRNQAKIRIKEKNCKSPSVGFELAGLKKAGECGPFVCSSKKGGNSKNTI